MCLTLPDDTLIVMFYGGTNGTPSKIGLLCPVYGKRHYETVIHTIEPLYALYVGVSESSVATTSFNWHT